MRKIIYILAIFAFLAPAAGQQGMLLVGPSGNLNYTPLLDVVRGGKGAYSVRLVNSYYSGPCLRVKRSSDSAEQDIGFLGTGIIDTVTLKSFVGANTGYVINWYDQSGYGYDLEQATASLQPYIVSVGNVQYENGLPAIIFASDRMTVPSSASLFIFLHDGTSSGSLVVSRVGTSSNPGTIYGYYGNNGTSTSKIGISFGYDDRASQSNNNAIYTQCMPGTGSGNFAFVQVAEDDIVTPNVQAVLIHDIDADNVPVADRSIVYFNNASPLAGNTSSENPTTSAATHNMDIGAMGNGAGNFTGSMQEVIFWNADISVLANEIKNNVNSFFSIY